MEEKEAAEGGLLFLDVTFDRGNIEQTCSSKAQVIKAGVRIKRCLRGRTASAKDQTTSLSSARFSCHSSEAAQVAPAQGQQNQQEQQQQPAAGAAAGAAAAGPPGAGGASAAGAAGTPGAAGEAQAGAAAAAAAAAEPTSNHKEEQDQPAVYSSIHTPKT